MGKSYVKKECYVFRIIFMVLAHVYLIMMVLDYFDLDTVFYCSIYGSVFGLFLSRLTDLYITENVLNIKSSLAKNNNTNKINVN